MYDEWVRRNERLSIGSSCEDGDSSLEGSVNLVESGEGRRSARLTLERREREEERDRLLCLRFCGVVVLVDCLDGEVGMALAYIHGCVALGDVV